MIKPMILKGFRDALPQQEILRKSIMQTLENVFSSFGLVPIDTPVLEYTEVLLGKGGGETDKQIYHFLDNGGRDVSMRFDLTVPFARYMAQHSNEVQLPFKRFHIAKVWRGENTQKGRYREFFQCDFDIVGIDNTASDLEILTIMHESMTALGINNFTIHVSHRGIFNEFLRHNNIEEHNIEILRIVDKLNKIGIEAVKELLLQLTTENATEQILKYISLPVNNFSITLQEIKNLMGSSIYLERMENIFSCLTELDIAANFVFDTSITRGLDYYTGIVYETILNDLPSIGSVCSGGRYNDLASLYTKEHLPGVGASVGLDRLLTALEEIDPSSEHISSADIAVFCLDETLTATYQKIANSFRKYGLKVDVFFGKKKFNQQFKLAEARNIRFAIIIGLEEKEQEVLNLKDITAHEEYQKISFEEALSIIKKSRNV